MGETTPIGWTDRTRNFWRGCSKVFEKDPVTGKIVWLLGVCILCYVDRNAARQGFEFAKITYTNWKAAEADLLRWSPSKIFLEDYGDLFHEAVPFEKIDEVMAILARVDKHHQEQYDIKHQYQILTKRPDRMEEYFNTRPVPDNFWLGVSIGNKASLWYLNCLKRIKAKIKWVSFEPLVEDIADDDRAYRDSRFCDQKYVEMYRDVFDEDGFVNLEGIDWIVIGGESGFNQIINGIQFPRKMELDWAYRLIMAGRKYACAVFFKQVGGVGGDGAGGCIIYHGVVLDPFGGMNTTGYVAAMLGRHFVTLEKQPLNARAGELRKIVEAPLLKQRRDA